MRLRRALPLRLQLALAMAGCVLATVAIGYGGLDAIGKWHAALLVAELPPAARRAQDALTQQRVPDDSDLLALLAESERFDTALGIGENRSLAALSVLAIACGVAASLLLSKRLARPLEDVAATARRIARGDLSARVPERTRGAREIAQLADDFNAMAASLEAADRELRESSAAIAHELRTPLTVLRGRLQGMHDRLFPTGPAEIEGLIRQVEQLGRIVDDLQTVSLAATGQLRLRIARVELGEELRRILATVEPDLAAAGLRVDLDLAEAPAGADPLRLQQATTALLDNVRRHAASGGEVCIETALRDGWAVLRVLDRGPGFPPEAHGKAFDRFWRADGSRSREGGGSGLGLSVVRAIAEAHGGSATAFARPGGGAVVEVTLPAADRPA